MESRRDADIAERAFLTHSGHREQNFAVTHNVVRVHGQLLLAFGGIWAVSQVEFRSTRCADGLCLIASANHVTDRVAAASAASRDA